jgi:outer membrane lipoprotein LolB
MTRSNGEIETASSPDGLVDQVLGSPIPVGGLRDWLRGQTGAAPVSGLQKNPDGQVAQFQQAGWRVALSRYDSKGPRLLQMNRSEASRDITVRLVIDGS